MKTRIKKHLQEQELFSSKEMVCVISVMLCLIIIILCYYEETVEQQYCQYQCIKKNDSSIVLKKSKDKLMLSIPDVLKFNEAKELVEFFQNLRIIIKWTPVDTKSFAQISEALDYLIDHGYSFYLIEKNGILGSEFNKDQLLNLKKEIELVLIRKNKYSEVEIGYQSLLK